MEKTLGRPQITGKNRLALFYLPLLWGSRPEAKKKLAGFLLPWQLRVKLFLQGADRKQLISGVGIPEMNKKNISHTLGIKFFCGQGN
jgi:hypothetical protein